MTTLQSQQADPFALYHAPLRAVRRWQAVAAACAVAAGLFALALFILSLQPPTVIVYDANDLQRTRVVRGAAQPRVTVAEARLFFAHMVALRYGWDSLTVKRDTQQYLAACYKTERARTQAFLTEAVEGASRGSSITRLGDYMRQGVAHAVQLPMDLSAIDCRPRSERRQWDCYVRAEMVTTALFSEAASNVGNDAASVPAAVVQPMQFVATLLESPRTGKTPYGLVLAALHAETASADPAPTEALFEQAARERDDLSRKSKQ